MELKHLTDYELYTGLQLFPVQATGVYPIVWSSPDRVYTCFCRSILCVIPTGFYIQPETISIPFIIPTGFIALSESELTSVQGQSTCDEIKDGLSFVCDQCNNFFKTFSWYMKHMQAR